MIIKFNLIESRILKFGFESSASKRAPYHDAYFKSSSKKSSVNDNGIQPFFLVFFFFFCKRIFPGNRILQRSTRVKLKYIAKTLSVISILQHIYFEHFILYPTFEVFKAKWFKYELILAFPSKEKIKHESGFDWHFFFHLSCVLGSLQTIW